MLRITPEHGKPQKEDAMIELLGMSSPNVVKIVIMLEELGLDYTLRHVDVFAGDQHDPAFLAMSPNAKVPVLVDDGTPVFESAAILLYLARKGGRFLPDDAEGRRQADQWLMFQTASIGPMFGQYVHFFRYAPTETYGLKRYASEVARLCGVLDRRAGESPWLAGADYGLADMATWPWLRVADMMFPLFTEQQLWSRLPALRRWFDAVGARPKVQAAVESIGTLAPHDMRAFSGADSDALDRFFGRGRWDHAAAAAAQPVA
jgi:GSH-dependent disulfide-bond oxidoreductase